MDDLQPGQRPLFMADSPPQDYPGSIETGPTFDEELAAWNDPSVEAEAGKEPSRGIQERWRAIARLHARGLNPLRIAKKLNYSPQSVVRVLSQPWVREEVQRFRASFENDPNAKIKDAALDAIDSLQELLLREDTKPNLIAEVSKFILEKATGKAKQEISVESGTFLQYMDLLKTMDARGETLDVPPARPRDVTPALASPQNDAEQPDRWDTWLDQNL